ncbi:MAG: hypothetical protein V3T14_03680 [Myxococcota bacterium]
MSRPPHTIHGKHALLVSLALAGTIPYGWAALLGVGLGGGIQVTSLWALDRTTSLLRTLPSSVGGLRSLLAIRFAVVVLVVGFVLFQLPVEPIPFAVGLGLVVPAALWHGLEVARRRPVEGR